MNAVWIKEEDNTELKNPWVIFTHVDIATGLPVSDNPFFPNRFLFNSYPKVGFKKMLIAGSDSVAGRKLEGEEKMFAKKDHKIIVRNATFYQQPGSFLADGTFFKNDDYVRGQTFVEAILQNNEFGLGYSKNSEPSRRTSYNAKGKITQFWWELPQELKNEGNWADMAEVNVIRHGDYKPMSFLNSSLRDETVEREKMCEWFAVNRDTHFPKAKDFDFSYVPFDAFQADPNGKDNQYQLIIT